MIFILVLILFFFCGTFIIFLYKGKYDYIIILFVSLLAVYSTYLALLYKYSSSSTLILLVQIVKDLVIVLTAVSLLFSRIKNRSKFQTLDWLVYAFVLLNALYFFLNISGLSLFANIMAIRANLMIFVLYFIGRSVNLQTFEINKVFRVVVYIGAFAGFITIFERMFNFSIQEYTGYAQYLNAFSEVSGFKGNYGLTWTFQTEGGIRRFSSFFADPLALGTATLVFLPAFYAYKNYSKSGYFYSFLILIALFNTVSRAPILSFVIQLVAFTVFANDKTNKKKIVVFFILLAFFGIYFVADFLQQFYNSTINWNNASSIAHLLAWEDGLFYLLHNPLGRGLGVAGTVALKTLGFSIGGENQYLYFANQLGVLGLFIYVFILYYSIKIAYKTYKIILPIKYKLTSLVSFLIKIGLIIPLFTANAETRLFSSYFSWFLVGMTVQIYIKSDEINMKVRNENRN